MSLPRLSFLCPALLRARLIPTSTARAVSRHYAVRHGTAVEPPPNPPVPPAESPASAPTPDPKQNPSETTAPPPLNPLRVRQLHTEPKIPDPKVPEAHKDPPPSAKSPPASAPAPDSSSSAAPKPPIKLPPPDNETVHDYAHHFDTYGRVRQLETEGGFTRDQSVAMMQGLHKLMTKNLHAARLELLSRSDMENDAYLFQAACTELRNEMQMKKKALIDQLRSERTRLETEFDLLNQAFMSDIMSLKDELNGMFNDRKMVTRSEQRAMENKIQELNYKITILINSELKSEIEKLRWQTTRRGLIAIMALATVVVVAIRLNKSDGKKKKEAVTKPDVVIRLSELAPEHSEAIILHAENK